MRDFEWTRKELYAVIKEDGTFAGVPCLNWVEAAVLAAGHEGSRIFNLTYNDDYQIYGD